MAHIAYGFFLGPLGTIGAGLSDPTPVKGNSTVIASENQALFDDQAYRSCYQKEARGNNVLATLFGLFIPAGIFLVLSV